LVLVAYGIGMAYPILTTQTRIDVRVDTLVDQQKELKPKVDMMLQETASIEGAHQLARTKTAAN